MEKLFEVKTKYTLKEHVKFNFALLIKGKEIIVYSIIILITIICGIIAKLWYAVAIAIFAPLAFVGIVYFVAKKNYDSNKAAKDAEMTIEFYNDSIVQKTELGSYKVELSKILKIVETKTNFYIMISRNQGLIIKKENMPEGLEEYIKNIKNNKI